MKPILVNSLKHTWQKQILGPDTGLNWISQPLKRVKSGPIQPDSGSSLSLPSCRYLIFHLIGSQTLVDFVHYPIALVPTSPAIEAGYNDLLSAGQVRGPAHTVAQVCFLTARARVPRAELWGKIVLNFCLCNIIRISNLNQSVSYTSINKGYFLDSSKPGGKVIWYQRSVGKHKHPHNLICFPVFHSSITVNRPCLSRHTVSADFDGAEAHGGHSDLSHQTVELVIVLQNFHLWKCRRITRINFYVISD